MPLTFQSVISELFQANVLTYNRVSAYRAAGYQRHLAVQALAGFSGFTKPFSDDI